jgi:hypothetical protein
MVVLRHLGGGSEHVEEGMQAGEQISVAMNDSRTCMECAVVTAGAAGPSTFRIARGWQVVRTWAGGKDADHRRAQAEGLRPHLREAGDPQQVLDFAGGVEGSARRGVRAAGLGRDGNAPARCQLPT